MHWEMASLSYVLYGCVDNLQICLRISKAVAHLTTKKAYFVLPAMVVTDSPGTGQMIVTALQGDRNCHMWIVTDWICQDWSNGICWIHASQSLQHNALQTSSMCSYMLVRIIGLCTSLHTMNNRQWMFMDNMTILTYYWISPFMSWYSLSPQPSANSIDFMVSGFPIITKCTLNRYNLFSYFLSIVLEVTMEFRSKVWQWAYNRKIDLFPFIYDIVQRHYECIKNVGSSLLKIHLNELLSLVIQI